jgi:hypothetical protein
LMTDVWFTFSLRLKFWIWVGHSGRDRSEKFYTMGFYLGLCNVNFDDISTIPIYEALSPLRPFP